MTSRFLVRWTIFFVVGKLKYIPRYPRGYFLRAYPLVVISTSRCCWRWIVVLVVVRVNTFPDYVTVFICFYFLLQDRRSERRLSICSTSMLLK